MRTFTGPSLASALALLLTATPPAHAVPIDFSESVSGDLSNPQHPDHSSHDDDSFRLVVPVTMDLVDEHVNLVPEPATLGLLGFALTALGLLGRRRRSRKKVPGRN